MSLKYIGNFQEPVMALDPFDLTPPMLASVVSPPGKAINAPLVLVKFSGDSIWYWFMGNLFMQAEKIQGPQDKNAFCRNCSKVMQNSENAKLRNCSKVRKFLHLDVLIPYISACDDYLSVLMPAKNTSTCAVYHIIHDRPLRLQCLDPGMDVGVALQPTARQLGLHHFIKLREMATLEIGTLHPPLLYFHCKKARH
ncbi:uncharacterized protein G2W53_001107 [Senna tora]|uniref:Uncharacterized protein n=1 Tax=Senna tora TaxID=362788 RepID=A0A835CM96_9FABA|nr:uncharacterized protein G2W53_001107 [Senna tora]